MTCIVGLVSNGDVYIGGDSAGVAGWSMTTRADAKVFTRDDEWIFGFTSSFRMGQLIRYAFDIPSRIVDKDISDWDEATRSFVKGKGRELHVDEYMATLWVDALRQCLKDGGYASTENGVEEGGVFLVGYQGRLFQVDSDYQIGESTLGYGAVGCGQDIALGALYASAEREPVERVEMALEAAERFSAGVRAPFIIKALEKQTDTYQTKDIA